MHWLNSLTETTREAVYAAMRRIGDRAAAFDETGKKLAPRYNEISTGSGSFEPFAKAQALFEFLRFLRSGSTPDQAAEEAKKFSVTMVEKWNANPKAVALCGFKSTLHLWVNTNDSLIEDAWRAVLNASKEPVMTDQTGAANNASQNAPNAGTTGTVIDVTPPEHPYQNLSQPAAKKQAPNDELAGMASWDLRRRSKLERSILRDAREDQARGQPVAADVAAMRKKVIDLVSERARRHESVSRFRTMLQQAKREVAHYENMAKNGGVIGQAARHFLAQARDTLRLRQQQIHERNQPGLPTSLNREESLARIKQRLKIPRGKS